MSSLMIKDVILLVRLAGTYGHRKRLTIFFNFLMNDFSRNKISSTKIYRNKFFFSFFYTFKNILVADVHVGLWPARL